MQQEINGEAMLAVLSPTTRALGPGISRALRGAVVGAPLPLGESQMIAGSRTVGLIAAPILLFVARYVVCQRQEVRAQDRILA